jgi:hypothetical protein
MVPSIFLCTSGTGIGTKLGQCLMTTGHDISYTGCRYTGQLAVLPYPACLIFGRKGTTMVSLSIFGTPVKVKGTVLVPIVALWGIVTWLGLYWHPERGFWQGVLIGLVTVLLLLPADFGHALAHIFSARYAGAPMDEILLSAGMPRTLYWNNEVSPDVHRIRAMGGPIFNVLGLLLSAVIYAVARGNPIIRELATWSAVGHGWILVAALLPLPMVDGGTLMKWTLVARGRTEKDADKMVRLLDWVMGIVGGIIGVGLTAMQMWIAAVIVVGISAVVIAIAAGKIR